MKFTVWVPEIWNTWYLVEADTEEQARQDVRDGRGIPIADMEQTYSDTFDDKYESWLVLPYTGGLDSVK